MKKIFNWMHKLLLIVIFYGFLPAQATPVDVSSPRPVIPPNVITTSNRPMIMLAASKDHSLFGPIYNDFEDLDGDGVIDTTFIPTFKYYGYFDPIKCYSYVNNEFEPVALATANAGTKSVITNGVTSTIATTQYTCGSDTATTKWWSGNFLNWSTMTRLDVVRKMLYGGRRSSDSNGTTVLELSKLNYDAHSFVKYYNGTDIRSYTPFTTADLTKTTGVNVTTTKVGNVTTTTGIYAGLSICITGSSDNSTASPNPPVMRMVKGNVRLWATVELEVCRWHDTNGYSRGTFGPKLARYYQNADKGNGIISHEITIPTVSADGATYSSSGTVGPELTLRVKVCDPNFLGEEHCQAFPTDSTSNYKPYGLFQEFGYSATGAARSEFGVIIGSYDKNYTAGALRKNMGDFADEINPTTGVFCHSTSSGCPANLASPDNRPTGNGAIKSFDAIVLNDRSADTYGSAGTPSSVSEGSLSSWGNPIGEMLVQALQYYAYNGSTPAQSNPSVTTKDSKVGMPVVAWSDPLSNASSTRKSLYGNSICRPLNTLLLSSSALSFDGQADTPFASLPNRARGDINSYTNAVGSAEGLNNSTRSVGSVTGGYGTSCSAKSVGNLSDVSGICPEAPAMGGTYQVAGAALYGNTSKIRTITSPPSDLINVKDALKVKTLAASLTGGSPRIDIIVPGTGTSTTNPYKYVYITPESVQSGGNISAPLTFASINAGNTTSNPQNPSVAIASHPYGSFIVTWNDILMGGDYDMDIVGYLRYDLIANSGTTSGWDIVITTDIPGICGGGAGTHGFSVIGVESSNGVSANGRYLTHQNFGGNLSGMPPTTEYLCGSSTYQARTSTLFTGKFGDTVCNLAGDGTTGDPVITGLPYYCSVKNMDYPVSTTFKMVGETNVLIKDPLYYAAKYGDFDSSSKNADNTYTDLTLPPNVSSWDKFNADGTIGADGIPDGYFLARRPDLLEAQLRKALDSLAKNANSAPATTSAQLTAGSFKYVAKFDSTTVTGDIQAFQVLANGQFDTNPTWEAGEKLQTRASTDYVAPNLPGNTRQIITNFGNKTTANTSAAVPFRWASLPTAYVAQMTTASTNKLSNTNAQIVLNYMRGDQSLENASTGLRVRGDNLLGPIVNATPWVESPPSANYQEDQFAGYRTFATTNQARAKLLWVAANDGMLHAFNVGTGAETFAYVPGVLANRLAEIPLQRGTTGRTRLNGANFTLDSTETQPSSTVWAYVDGSPYTADVKTNIVPAVTTGTTTTPETGTWKTMVFSSLGRGGRGIFALDASSISTLTAAEGSPNSIFQWQFTSDDDADLGYLINDVSLNSNSGQANPVVRLNNGKFGLLLGNGYKSANGKAVLYILYIDGPTLSTGWTGQYVKIVADAGSGNGLMNPMWVDRDNDGTADVVYAGDLKGNLWKFNISDKTTTATWGVAYKGTGSVNRPLFTAQNSVTSGGTTTVTPLPITAAPEYVYPAFDGLIINFGTGISLETGDFPNTAVPQRFYGVWDRPSFATSASSGTGPMILADMSTLIRRTYARDSTTGIVTATPTVTTTGGVTTSTYASIDWTTNGGWYFNFPGAPQPPYTSTNVNLSEMLLSDPDLQAGFLIFPTVRQKDAAVASCNSTPDVTLYVIDPIAGIPTRTAQGVTSDGTLIAGTPAADQKWVTVSNRTDAPWTTTCTAAEAGCTNIVNGIGTKAAACAPGNKVASPQSATENRTLCYNPLGRVQWREIPGLRTDQ
ncbi:MAG: PilC/PilY family type IV pilus protein [Rhodoferax sp.]|uniref:pilus assembly protein n=1 Tax=Rhodoferax sp. TaxID=50421 RepID=UPI003263B24F